MKLIVLIASVVMGVALAVFSQTSDGELAKKQTAATSGELFETISRMDRTIFDAFNSHELERLMALFSEDLEFYDDGDGLSDYQHAREDFKKMFASVPDIRRELVPGSLEVYPLKGYGAIEIGQHRFCHREGGKEECGVFKFAMVWRKTGDAWKIARVISYAH